jgi:hypothetical protein
MVRLALSDSPGQFGPVTRATRRFLLAALAAAPCVALAWTATASAKPLVGKDGKIHACYRVKGKPKGVLRVVKSPKARCRKGERKVAWVTAGAIGAPGPEAPAGSASATASTSALEAKVAGLTARMERLEGLVSDTCSQATALTTQVNSLASALDDTVLEGIIPLGLALFIPALPSVLPDYACP